MAQGPCQLMGSDGQSSGPGWNRWCPKVQCDPNKVYKRSAGAAGPKPARLVFEAIVYVLRTGCQWKALPAERFSSASAVQKFMDWSRRASLKKSGRQGWPSTTSLKASRGDGRALTGRCSRAPLAQRDHGAEPDGSGKKWDKRHLLVDGRGVPLSLVVTGANVHDDADRDGA